MFPDINTKEGNKVKKGVLVLGACNLETLTSLVVTL